MGKLCVAILIVKKKKRVMAQCMIRAPPIFQCPIRSKLWTRSRTMWDPTWKATASQSFSKLSHPDFYVLVFKFAPLNY